MENNYLFKTQKGTTLRIKELNNVILSRLRSVGAVAVTAVANKTQQLLKTDSLENIAVYEQAERPTITKVGGSEKRFQLMEEMSDIYLGI